MRRALLTCMLLGSAACSSASHGNGAAGSVPAAGTQSMNAFDPGPAPSNGFQLIAPAISDIEPGADYEYCTWTDVTLDQEAQLKGLQGFQTRGGHHLILYYTSSPQPAGTQRICQSTDMESFGFGLGAAGEGATQTNVLPGDLAIRIPKGSQLVLNHHWLNASGAAIAVGRSAANVFLADPGATIVHSSALNFVNLGLQIPPGPSSVEITCTMDQDYAVWDILPHMHEHGAHATVDLTSASTGMTSRLFDVDWTPEFAFNPPRITKDEASPLLLQKGDTLHMECDYQNTSNTTLTFGQEMCVTAAQVVDTNGVGNRICSTGSSWLSN